MKKIIWLLAFIILMAGVGVAVYLVKFMEHPLAIESTYPGDVRLWEKILDVQEVHEFESSPKGVVIPHHLIAADQIAQFYAGLAQVTDPSMIVLIGPNHFEKTLEEDIQTCLNCVYKTTMGDLEIEKEFVKKMANDGAAAIVNNTFPGEHAMFAHTPFIKNNFPDTKIVPVLMQWYMDPSVPENFALWLNENLPEDALVIASVDFSHYVPVNAADFHDLSALATLKNFDYENVYDLEVDSPDSLYTLLKLMELRGAQTVERLAHTNSQDYLSEIQKETTSHHFLTFSEGKVDQEIGVGILSFGNMPADSGLSIVNDWVWDRDYDITTDQTVTKYFRDIRFKDDRFLVGNDFLVFDLPDGECMKQGQNYTDIAFCKLSEDGPVEKQNELLRKTVADSSIIYVQYDFAGNELSEEREQQLKDLVDLGADIVVGKGINSVEKFEVYEDSLIFYSLGAFVSESKLVTELDAADEGLIVGVWARPYSYEIYFFRVQLENTYPKFMDYTKNEEFFGQYFLGIESEWEDPALGIIRIAR